MGEGIDFDKLSIEERFDLLQEQEDDAQIAMSFLSLNMNLAGLPSGPIILPVT